MKQTNYSTPELTLIECELGSAPLCQSMAGASSVGEDLTENSFGEF